MIHVMEIKELRDCDKLLLWRMEVIGCVFENPTVGLKELYKQNKEYYRRHVSAGTYVGCEVTAGDKGVGCGGVCFYDELPSPDNPSGRCAYIMNIYVRRAYRGCGVGIKIVNWLVAEARKRGITKIVLETTDAGRGLYRATGFGEYKDMMKYVKI